MRKHGCTPSRRDKHVTLAAISPAGVARGRFVGGQQSGLAGCKPPPLFTRGASSCSSQGRRQGEPWGASPRLSAPTYLPTNPNPNLVYLLERFLYQFVADGHRSLKNHVPMHKIRFEETGEHGPIATGRRMVLADAVMARWTDAKSHKSM